MGRVIWDEDATQRNNTLADAPTELEQFYSEFDRIIPDHRAFLMLADDDPFEMKETQHTPNHPEDFGNAALDLTQQSDRIQTHTTTLSTINDPQEIADSHLPLHSSLPHLASSFSGVTQSSGSQAQTSPHSADSVDTPGFYEDGVNLSSPDLFVSPFLLRFYLIY